MSIDRTEIEERAARIGVLLEDLHLTVEELTELAKQAVQRALRKTVEQSRADFARAAGKES